MKKDWFGWMRRLFGLSGETESRLILEGIARIDTELILQHHTMKKMSTMTNSLMLDQIELRKKLDIIISTIDQMRCLQDDSMRQTKVLSKKLENSIQKLLNEEIAARRQEILTLTNKNDDTAKALNHLTRQTEILSGNVHMNHTESVNLAKKTNKNLHLVLSKGKEDFNEVALQSKKRDEDLLKSVQAIWMVELSNRLDQKVENRRV